MEQGGLFAPKDLEQGKHAVVGDCNGVSMQERYDQETPLFAKAIMKHVDKVALSPTWILDYGCGVGRIAKALIETNAVPMVTGLDASPEMRTLAQKNVNSDRFKVVAPHELTGKEEFDIVYCIYVLQHIPAIDLRDALYRIYASLSDGGVFIYCSSDYRMAIKMDGGGFWDDRGRNGVNLRREIGRLFHEVSPLFSQEEMNDNPILQKMISGQLPHPAYVYKARELTGYIWNFPEPSEIKCESTGAAEGKDKVRVAVPKADGSSPRKLILTNRLAPGDILVMTNAIRDLHKAYPGKYQTEIRSPCNEIFENSPYQTKLLYDEGRYKEIERKFPENPGQAYEMDGITVIDMQYPLIHRSGQVGAHFSEGHREFLEDLLAVGIPQTDLCPEIFLSQNEISWPTPYTRETGKRGKYWVLNAGSKSDYQLKQYPFFQEVADLLSDKLTLVQIGAKAHNHVRITGADDIVGKTNLRDLFRLVYHAEGVITCVSLPMHVAAAFRKPCVVVAGAREGTRWELYANHQFLYVNGCLPCASYDGCWRSKTSDCDFRENGVPRCMSLIEPEDVAKSVMRYYKGGMLQLEEVLV